MSEQRTLIISAALAVLDAHAGRHEPAHLLLARKIATLAGHPDPGRTLVFTKRQAPEDANEEDDTE